MFISRKANDRMLKKMPATRNGVVILPICSILAAKAFDTREDHSLSSSTLANATSDGGSTDHHGMFGLY